MATTLKKVQILTKNDKLSNWNDSTLVLGKGEVALGLDDNGKYHIRVGDGTKTWSQLSDDNILPSNNYYEGIKQTVTDEGGTTRDETVEETFARLSQNKEPCNGDVVVVKTVIDKAVDEDDTDPSYYSYTSYVYDQDVSAWKAMDGNYDASNVYIGKDITLCGNYTSVGNLSKGNANATKVYESRGMSVLTFLENMLSQDKDPTVTQPSVGLTFKNGTATVSKAYYAESGTAFTPAYSATFNAGSYTYGPATGVTATSWTAKYLVNNTQQQTLSTQTGTFPAVTLTSDGSTNNYYQVSITATYGNGVYANTALGKTSTLRVTAGSKSATSVKVTAYRKVFYGTSTSQCDLSTLDSDAIRTELGLTHSTAPMKDGSTFSITIPVGAMSVIIAYPKIYGTLSSVKDVNGLNAEIASAFGTPVTVSVNSANGADPIDYYVYCTNYADAVADGKQNTYTVTI